MNAVKEFKGSYVKLFSNALHNGFHTTIWKYLRSLEDKTKIHLSDELLTEYGNNIAAETELNRETRAHVNTAALNEADAKRDKAMSYLFNVIEAAKEAVVPDIQAGGMALSVVILPYKGIQQLAHKEESAAIDGCLQDIRKPENSPYVLSLNLGAALSAADEANQEYKDLEQERRDDKRAKKLEPAKVVRPRTDANFKRICDLIYASQLLCTVPEDLTVIEGIIDHINSIIEEYRTSYNQSQGQKDAHEDKPAEGEEPTESEKPTEGEEPTGGEEQEPDDRPVVQ